MGQTDHTKKKMYYSRSSYTKPLDVLISLSWRAST